MRNNLTLRSIGTIRSPFKQKFGTPRQSGVVPLATGTIHLDPTFAPPGCLEGLSLFSHIWVIFHFHKNTNETLRGKVHPPRLNGKKMGVFATRTPHRTNPIGMSVLKLIDVNEEGLILSVSGLDLIDETPIFDIKPYISENDSILDATDGWTEKMDLQNYQVEWAPNALDSLNHFNNKNHYKEFVEQTLSIEVRNLEDKSKNEMKNFKSLLGEGDVEFKVCPESLVVQVINLEKKEK